MGMCQSSAANDEVTKTIDRQQKVDRAKDSKTIKMLLLGAGESGKSTIFKQLKIIHEKGFSPADRQHFKETVWANTISNMKDLIQGAANLDITTFDESSPNFKFVKLVQDTAAPVLEPDVCEAIRILWADPDLKRAYARRSEFQIADTADYFFDSIDRISDKDYVPTDDDILRCRVRTTGVTEMPFEMDSVIFKIFDVGGQRSERRKWIHCFEDTNAVIYVAALSEYDQKIFEDNATNRMHEALKLFGETCNLNYFANTSMLLFLNKKDLFEEKITKSALAQCFPEYEGPNTYDAGLQYITEKFSEKNLNENRSVYVHVTCATDTGNIRFVFNVVKDSVLTSNLMGSHF